jgi:hypothetical protein
MGRDQACRKDHRTTYTLYKKQPTTARPCAIWPAGSFAHLIHSQTHNLWGQLKDAKPRHPGPESKVDGIFT